MPNRLDVLLSKQERGMIEFSYSDYSSANKLSYQFLSPDFSISASKLATHRLEKMLIIFENVDGVIFEADISTYDQMAPNPHNKSKIELIPQLLIALDYFKRLCASACMQRKSIILVLNRKDLFLKKFETHRFKQCFPDYNKGSDAALALKYVVELFRSANASETREIYIYYLPNDGLPTRKFIIIAINDIIITKNLSSIKITADERPTEQQENLQ